MVDTLESESLASVTAQVNRRAKLLRRRPRPVNSSPSTDGVAGADDGAGDGAAEEGSLGREVGATEPISKSVPSSVSAAEVSLSTFEAARALSFPARDFRRAGFFVEPFFPFGFPFFFLNQDSSSSSASSSLATFSFLDLLASPVDFRLLPALLPRPASSASVSSSDSHDPYIAPHDHHIAPHSLT